MYCTNKTKMRRDLDILQKRQGVAGAQTPSGLKLDIVPPIKMNPTGGPVSSETAKAGST
jgi:hypothetical protein